MTLPPRLTTSLADWIANASPGERVIVQTSPHGSNGDAMRARAAGLITTVIVRADGHAFHLIAIRLRAKAPKPRQKPGSAAGITREGTHPEQVLGLYRSGLSKRDIAQMLGLSERKVREYIAQAIEEGVA